VTHITDRTTVGTHNLHVYRRAPGVAAMEPRNTHLWLVRPPGITTNTGFEALVVPDLEREPANGIEMDPGLYVPGEREWERDHCCRPAGPEGDGHRHSLDLSALSPEPAPEGLMAVAAQPGMELPGLLSPKTGEAWNPHKHLATSRRFIAHWLLAMLSGVLVVSWLSVILNLAAFEDVQALMTIVFAPMIGLVGAATGFYFGEKSSEDKDP
jgi:hypothetical protein